MNSILLKVFNRISKGILLLPLSLGFSLITVAQQAELDTLKRRFENHQANFLQEKLYVHLDRSYYLTGEIIWFKVYNVDGTLHKPLEISKVAYIEILSPENHPVLQTKVALINGLGEGSIFLPASINSGNYKVRAYTNWMRNFDAEVFFRTAITIVNPFKEPEEVTTAITERYEAQFFPEGGNLVSGLKSRVAFRVTNNQGIGVEFKGEVYDQNKNLVTTFKPNKFGIGNFTFTPSANQTYTAVIIDPSGGTTTYNLPAVNEVGYVMNVHDSVENRIVVTIQKKGSTKESGIPFVYLVVNSGQMIALAKTQVLLNGKTFFQVNVKDLREGISQFTVFDDKLQPVAERLYFRRPEKKLMIQTLTDIPVYGKRRKVKVEITSEDNAHQPEPAKLSMAITRNDSLSSIRHDNIQDYLLFTSELKGRIEAPEYYFETQDREAIDNLLLTHGWRRFTWESILAPKKSVPSYIPEYNGHVINARIIDESRNPIIGVNTYLSSPNKSIQLYTSRSNGQGEIHFEMKYFYGNKRIISQAEPGKIGNYRIEVKDPFSEKFATYPLPTFQVKPEQEQQLLVRSIALQTQDIYHEKKLNNFSTPTFDSLSFYGKADETYFLSDYTRFPTMEDVLREYVPGVWVRKRKGGFYFKLPNRYDKTFLMDDPLVLLDGLPVFDLNKIMAFDPLKVRKLEVITSRYFLGYSSLLGIVSFTTYAGDLAGFELDPQGVSLDYEGLQLHREFYSPKYENQQQQESRVPDQRNLLYWNPSITTDKNGRYQIEFYTSDLEGDFQIVVEGITKNGLAGSSKSSFRVRANDAP